MRCVKNVLLLTRESDRSNTICKQMLPLSEHGGKPWWRPRGSQESPPTHSRVREPPRRISSPSSGSDRRPAPGRRRPILGLPRPFRKTSPCIPAPIGQAASSARLTEEPEKRNLFTEWGPPCQRPCGACALGARLGVPRGRLSCGETRAPGQRGGAPARGSLPRGQVGAGRGRSGCGGRRGLGREVDACGSGGRGQRTHRGLVAGEGGVRCRRRPAGAR